MTPKIVHYCWFGKKEKPESFYRWLETWKRVLPDYEIKEWNESNFNVDYCDYSREAYNMRNYAFVSDVCRVYALYMEGGIYLDTDVEVCKSFDEYLYGPGVVGMESELVGTGVMIAPKKDEWTESFLYYYINHHFINPFGHFNRKPNTQILTDIILPGLPEGLRPKVLPMGYFAGIDWVTKKADVKPYTVAIHHYEASWRYKKTLLMKIALLVKGFLYRYFSIRPD